MIGHGTVRTAGSARARRAAARGQSVVEFALILPIMLAFVGAAVDVARLFQAWIVLESATRDAAEYAATYATTSSEAQTNARSVVCLQAANLPGFVAGGTPETCTQPAVTIVSFDVSTTAPGASTRYPLASVTVKATLPFRTLFSYPFIADAGTWTLITDQSYTVAQNR